MRNPLARALCRLAAVAAAAVAVYYAAWMPEHADHVLKSLTVRTQAAMQMDGDRAVIIARETRPRPQPIEGTCRLSVDYHLIAAVNDRILGRNGEAIEHYTAA